MPRLFFACEQAAALNNVIRRGQDILEERHAPFNRTPAQNLHLTLYFIGACSTQAAADYALALKHLTLPTAPLVQLSHWGCFPRKDEAIVWAGLAPEEGLNDLRRALVEAVQAAVPDAPPAGRFTPHITVARRVRRSAALSETIAALPLYEKATALPALTLFESRRTAQGMQYVPLVRRLL